MNLGIIIPLLFLLSTLQVVVGTGCVALDQVRQSGEECDAGNPSTYGYNVYGNRTERIHIATLYNHTSDVINVHFSSDGRYLVSCGFESSINLWEVATKQVIRKYAIKEVGGYDSAKISPDSRTIASGGYDGSIRFWDVFTGSMTWTTGNHSSLVNAIRFSPDGSLVASGSWDNTIKLWDVFNRSLIATFTRQTRDVNDVDFSPDGNLLAMASSDFSIKLWDVHNRSFVANMSEHRAIARAIDFSPDGKLLVSGGDDAHIILWDVENRTMIARWKAHNSSIESIKFSTNGTIIASGSKDNTVKVWNVKKRSLITTLNGHRKFVNMVDFNPTNDYLASGSSDGTIIIWDLSGSFHKKLIDGHMQTIKAVAAAPTTPHLASGDEEGIIKIFDVHTKVVLHTLKTHTVAVTALDFSKTASSYLVSGDAVGQIHLWDAASNFARVTLNDQTIATNLHSDAITGVSISKGNEASETIFVASSSWDGTIKLWTLSPSKILSSVSHNAARVDRGILCVLFSPSTAGDYVVTGDGNGQVIIYSYSDTGLVMRSTINSVNPWYITTLSYNGNGQLLLVGNANAELNLYNVENLQSISYTVIIAHTPASKGIVHAEIVPSDRGIRGTDPLFSEIYVVFGEHPTSVYVYSTSSIGSIRQIFSRNWDPIQAMKISKYDGSIFVAGGETSITRWTLERGCTHTCSPMQGFQCYGAIGSASNCCKSCPVGFACQGNDVCVSMCGNGVLDPGEQCDDGFITDGDGCSSRCTVEPMYTCRTDPGQASVCGIRLIVTAQGTCPDNYADLVKLGKRIFAHNIPSHDPDSIRIIDITCREVPAGLLRMRILDTTPPPTNVELKATASTDEQVNPPQTFAVPTGSTYLTGGATALITGINHLFIYMYCFLYTSLSYRISQV